MSPFFCGWWVGGATALITNPIWVVNTRMTAKKRSLESSMNSFDSLKSSPCVPQTTWEAIREILKQDGVMEFWKGVIPALILVINPIIQFTVFEQLKNRLEKRRGKQGLGGLDFFGLGAFSKLIATGITYPYM